MRQLFDEIRGLPGEAVRKPALFAALGAVFFICAGAAVMKLTGDAGIVTRLDELGFGDNWRYFIGTAEIVGAPAIFVPRLRRLALLCLWPFAVGGLALHIGFGHESISPAIIASLVIPVSLWLDGGLTFRRNETSELAE